MRMFDQMVTIKRVLLNTAKDDKGLKTPQRTENTAKDDNKGLFILLNTGKNDKGLGVMIFNTTQNDN